MRRNPHVRFLGGWRVATLSGYPVGGVPGTEADGLADAMIEAG